MFLVKDMELNYGIEITASHNPPHYNGIKLIVREGRDAPVETTRQLEEIIAGIRAERVPRILFDECVKRGQVEYLKHPFNRFIDSILSKLDTEAIRERDLRVLFNPMHGSGTYPLMTILYTTRCTVDLVESEKDAYFSGRDPAPTSRISGTTSFPAKLHFSIAFDGDGTSWALLTQTEDTCGRQIPACFISTCTNKGWRGPVVRRRETHNSTKSRPLRRECWVPVGFKYISAAIDKYDAMLGGESSAD